MRGPAAGMIDHAGLLDGLAGEWQLGRVIAAEGATMAGRAAFVVEADGTMLYREEGELVLRNGRRLAAYRHYRFRAEPGALALAFVDGPDGGKPYVTLRFGPDPAGGLVARDVHPCRDDRYDVTWRLWLPDSFATDIIVYGPRHDYRALTTYRRNPIG